MTLREVRYSISNHLEEIATYFKPGIKLTIVCRHPGLPDGGVVMTDDDLGLAIAEIRKLQVGGITTPPDTNPAPQAEAAEKEGVAA
jgi:hypothetical protein